MKPEIAIRPARNNSCSVSVGSGVVHLADGCASLGFRCFLLQAATNSTSRNRKSPVFMRLVAVLRLLRLFSTGDMTGWTSVSEILVRRYNATKRYGFYSVDKGCSV